MARRVAACAAARRRRSAPIAANPAVVLLPGARGGPLELEGEGWVSLLTPSSEVRDAGSACD